MGSFPISRANLARTLLENLALRRAAKASSKKCSARIGRPLVARRPNWPCCLSGSVTVALPPIVASPEVDPRRQVGRGRQARQVALKCVIFVSLKLAPLASAVLRDDVVDDPLSPREVVIVCFSRPPWVPRHAQNHCSLQSIDCAPLFFVHVHRLQS